MYEEDIKQQKRNIINMVYDNKVEAHLSPAMAMMEIFNVLLRDIMKIEKGVDDRSSDKLVLSNGHTALALYAVYEMQGIISKEEFYTFSKRNTRIGIHPDRHYTPGMIISTGSLGHGLPNAIGVAYSWKLHGKKNRIFITVGDGELNEGSIWECVIFAGRMKLDNICCVIDDNKSTDYMPNIVEKFKAFDWDAIQIDGHDEESIRLALLKQSSGKPYVVVANTVKGHGISLFEEKPDLWHFKSISDEEYNIILKELSK
jgi:transketolase